MARSRPDSHAGASWSDVDEFVTNWGEELGVSFMVQIGFNPRLSSGAYVEVTIREGMQVGLGEELVRLREAFPVRKAQGHAGAVLWALSSSIRALEAEPWSWSKKMRRALREV